MPNSRPEDVARALKGLRLGSATSEYELHASVLAALEEGGFDVIHEAVLAPRCRIDFLVGSVGVEIKRGRPSPGRLREQLGRYLASPLLSALVLVVEKNASLPSKICGKPVIICALNKLWGISLP